MLHFAVSLAPWLPWCAYISPGSWFFSTKCFCSWAEVMSCITFQSSKNSSLECFPSEPGTLRWSVHIRSSFCFVLKGDSVFSGHPGSIEVLLCIIILPKYKTRSVKFFLWTPKVTMVWWTNFSFWWKDIAVVVAPEVNILFWKPAVYLNRPDRCRDNRSYPHLSIWLLVIKKQWLPRNENFPRNLMLEEGKGRYESSRNLSSGKRFQTTLQDETEAQTRVSW